MIYYLAGETRGKWNLRNDDLAAQSEECLDFLASLFEVK
jgi:hypothetical protein